MSIRDPRSPHRKRYDDRRRELNALSKAHWLFRPGQRRGYEYGGREYYVDDRGCVRKAGVAFKKG